jgi:hypothetical protein
MLWCLDGNVSNAQFIYITVVVGYAAAAVFAFFFSEWFIHLPVVDAVSAWPLLPPRITTSLPATRT